MDINIIGSLAICGIFGVWRLYDYRRQQAKKEMIRERVAWMLWLASDRVAR
jgi:hypothetical protein